MASVTVSVNRVTYSPEEPVSVLVVPDRGAEEISGTIRIERIPETAEGRLELHRELPVDYRGPPTRFISSTFSAPPKPGAYRVTFSGPDKDTPRTAATFFVSVVTGRSAPRTLRPQRAPSSPERLRR